MVRVYKILKRAAWEAAKRAGRFDGAGVDLADGYIHLSTAAQAPQTARLHFAGQADLVLLRLGADRLGAALKWEPSRGGQLFPHLYGPLDCSLVEAVSDIPLDAAGVPQLGPLPE
jgi:uncharacterized protein (DUF952 family)